MIYLIHRHLYKYSLIGFIFNKIITNIYNIIKENPK